MAYLELEKELKEKEEEERKIKEIIDKIIEKELREKEEKEKQTMEMIRRYYDKVADLEAKIGLRLSPRPPEEFKKEVLSIVAEYFNVPRKQCTYTLDLNSQKEKLLKRTIKTNTLCSLEEEKILINIYRERAKDKIICLSQDGRIEVGILFKRIRTQFETPISKIDEIIPERIIDIEIIQPT